VLDTAIEAPDDFLPPGEELLVDDNKRYQVSARSTVVLIGK
jgi:hypothetical protein